MLTEGLKINKASTGIVLVNVGDCIPREQLGIQSIVLRVIGNHPQTHPRW